MELLDAATCLSQEILMQYSEKSRSLEERGVGKARALQLCGGSAGLEDLHTLHVRE